MEVLRASSRIRVRILIFPKCDPPSNTCNCLGNALEGAANYPNQSLNFAPQGLGWFSPAKGRKPPGMDSSSLRSDKDGTCDRSWNPSRITQNCYLSCWGPWKRRMHELNPMWFISFSGEFIPQNCTFCLGSFDPSIVGNLNKIVYSQVHTFRKVQSFFGLHHWLNVWVHFGGLQYHICNC